MVGFLNHGGTKPQRSTKEHKGIKATRHKGKKTRSLCEPQTRRTRIYERRRKDKQPMEIRKGWT
jgi:hypothetical protein